MPKISVIVPVYNSANFLPECIESVLNQTFKDFELICVNDGSSDNSLDVLNDYAQKDNRLKVITQENNGAASARNNALRHMSGDYVLFLDSDDYLTSNALNDLYVCSISNDLDLMFFKIINFDDETREKSTYSYFELGVLKSIVGSDVFSYEDIKKRFFRIPATVTGKLFKKELLEEMEFNQGLIFEDNPFCIEILFKFKKAKVFDEYLYMRRIRNDSVMNSNFSKFKDCVEIYDIIENIIKRYGKYEDLKGQLFHRRCRDIFLRFSQVPDEFKEEFFNIIKSYFESREIDFKKDGSMEIASKRSRFIFNKVIECENYKEFELSVELFDLKKEVSKLKKENKKYKNEIKKLNNTNSKKIFKKLFKH